MVTIRKRFAKIVPGAKPPRSEADNLKDSLPGVADDFRGRGRWSDEPIPGRAASDPVAPSQDQQKATFSASGVPPRMHSAIGLVGSAPRLHQERLPEDAKTMIALVSTRGTQSIHPVPYRFYCIQKSYAGPLDYIGVVCFDNKSEPE
jgi:hypothetical protein